MDRRWLALGAVVLGIAGIAALAVRVGPDASLPAGLAIWLEPAREVARREAGLLSLLPIRLVEARCQPDGRAAVLTFEPVIGQDRLLATMAFPEIGDWDKPGATVTIVTGGAPDLAATTTEACAAIPGG
jgi:hypothetical protein